MKGGTKCLCGFLVLWATFYLGLVAGGEDTLLLIVPVFSLAILSLVLFVELRAKA